jgi:flagellar biosynthesis/type III secretory pathway protein FliH
MSLSNLLRGHSVTVRDRLKADQPGTEPRIFGTRVLRSDQVGLQKPLSLAVPTSSVAQDGLEGLQGEQMLAPPPPPPDFAELEEAARVQGFNIGFEQGQAAGLAAAEAATSDSVHRLSVLVSTVQENNATFFRAAEREVVELALQIAQKVVEREVENMPDLAVNVIRAALEEMDARTVVRVRVSPDDEQLLRRRWTQVVPSGVGPERIELQQDEHVHSGGAIIETTHGQVDAQLESKLAQLGNALWTFVMDVNSSQESVDA